MTPPVVAIAGCPNAGKTTLFNHLAGARHTVGNWPGQTVERHEGVFSIDGEEFRVVDLPGIYGLVAVSAEESIATGFLAGERPAAAITVVDVTKLNTGLHLVAQVAEAGIHQVVALNMWDVADRRGLKVDLRALEEALGAAVVPTVARRGEGMRELRAAVAEAARAAVPPVPLVIDYGPVVERHLGTLVEAAVDCPEVLRLGPPRWSMLQLLAGDEETRRRVAAIAGGEALLDAARAEAAAVGAETGTAIEVVLAERRFEWVARLLERVAVGAAAGTSWSDRFDRVLTHRWLGLPIFLLVMWVVLRVTADVTAPFLDWVDGTISGPVSRWAAAGLAAVSLEGGWVESLVVDGILAGVGGVLVFIPVLFGLYLMLALLEDSGYMARTAVVMDRAMRAVGIPGKAFLPMMVGFGCTVPAIYATRTLDSKRDRLLAGLLTPFMSCGARLPVYVLLAGVFFVGRRSTVVLAMYLLGIVVAGLIGLLLSKTILRESDPSPLVIVLPDFRLPDARTVWSLVRLRTWAFIKGAGTVILAASVAVWLLLAIPVGGGGFADTDVEQSAFGAASKGASVALGPLGFGEWEQAGALLSGFVAKEVVVSTFAQLYAVDGDEGEEEEEAGQGFVADLREIGSGFAGAAWDTLRAIPAVVGLSFVDLEDDASSHLQSAIRSSFEESSGGHGALAGLAFMVFVLLYTPCMAAVAAFRHEFGARWTWVSVIGQFLIAWLGALITFQGGRLLGLG
ncbi:MAG: ferrous iron transport protein B [Acidimicrobiia bacterium]|nr:ferrous iron transport protein B [Acidimicrobiia bacterium]